MAAISLWNNMFQPINKKTTQLNEDIICPTEKNPYFYTNKNSNI
jgi:hypothetical protein